MYLVGNGRRVHFWKDCWCGEEPLFINFPLFVFFGSQYGGICKTREISNSEIRAKS